MYVFSVLFTFPLCILDSNQSSSLADNQPLYDPCTWDELRISIPVNQRFDIILTNRLRHANSIQWLVAGEPPPKVPFIASILPLGMNRLYAGQPVLPKFFLVITQTPHATFHVPPQDNIANGFLNVLLRVVGHEYRMRRRFA